MDLLGAIKNKIQGGVDTVQQTAAGVVDKFKDAGKSFENNLAKPMTINKIGPRSYDENMAKYSMASHMYPNDLLSESYAGNYAVFYINVSDESKLFTPEETVELDPNIEKRNRSKFVGGSINTAGVVGAAAAVNIGGGMAAGSGAIKAAGDQLAPTIGLGFAAQQAPKSYRLQRRLKNAIALHVPNQLSVRYGTQWGEEDTAAVQALYDAGSSAFAAAASEKGGLAKMAGAAGAVTGVGSEAMANYGLTKSQNAGAVSADRKSVV